MLYEVITGVLEVCRVSGIDPKLTMGVGNDYNDFDLLEFTRHSFLTDNRITSYNVCYTKLLRHPK